MMDVLKWFQPKNNLTLNRKYTMSIENNLERIAVALEALVALKSGANALASGPTHEQKIANLAVPKSKPTAATVDTATTSSTTPMNAPSPASPAPTEVPSAPAAPSLVVNSPKECNTLLVAEYDRLGGNAKGALQTITSLMENRFKVRSVNDLSKDQYAPLILAVRELK
jgi:hypothetical protein